MTLPNPGLVQPTRNPLEVLVQYAGHLSYLARLPFINYFDGPFRHRLSILARSEQVAIRHPSWWR